MFLEIQNVFIFKNINNRLLKIKSTINAKIEKKVLTENKTSNVKNT